MIPYNQWDVVLLRFPSTNFLKFKKRPAVIINTDWFFYLRGDYIAMALTSQPKKDCYDFSLRDWSDAGLVKPTTARIGKLVTVHTPIIYKRIGKLSQFDSDNITERLYWIYS